MDKNETHLQVQGYELDSFGHVNNAVYLNYLESDRWCFLDKTGMMAYLSERRIYPVVTQIHINYLREMKVFCNFCVRSEWSVDGIYIVVKQDIWMKKAEKEIRSVKAVVKMVLISEDRLVQEIPEGFLSDRPNKI